MLGPPPVDALVDQMKERPTQPVSLVCQSLAILYSKQEALSRVFSFLQLEARAGPLIPLYIGGQEGSRTQYAVLDPAHQIFPSKCPVALDKSEILVYNILTNWLTK